MKCAVCLLMLKKTDKDVQCVAEIAVLSLPLFCSLP